MAHADTDNFIISFPRTTEEKEGLYALHRSVHGPGVETTVRKIIEGHPDIHAEHFLIAQVRGSDRVVATLATIPWRLRWYGIELKVLELGFVATDETYRMKGLQRMLNDAFVHHMTDGGYEMSIIQGIPGFYSNFGYHYAIPLENQVIIELHSIAADAEGTPYSIHKSGDGDYDFIALRYADHVARYDIASLHAPEHYRFMADLSHDTELDSELYLVCENGAPAGYFKINLHGFTEGLILGEMSDMGHDLYVAVLLYLKKLAVERGKPFIKCALPDFHDFTQLAYAMGAHKRWSYQYQVKLNLKQFFTTIRPLLEERVEKSMFRGLSYRLPMSFFSTGIALQFTNGAITGIEEYRAQQEECCMPLRSFYPLAMGCRPLAGLMDEDNEIMITGKNRMLVETLFPAGNSYLYVHY